MKEAKYLVGNFYVGKVIFNCGGCGGFNYLENELIEVLDENDIKYDGCIEKLNVGDVKLHFLNDKVYDNENDNSSVVYAEFDDYKFLFMGDAGTQVEEDILENYNLKDMDILKVVHHGSNTSSSKYFIDSINQKYSIISVGKSNRFGHQVNGILKNKIYRIDYDGSRIFNFENDKLKIVIYAMKGS